MQTSEESESSVANGLGCFETHIQEFHRYPRRPRRLFVVRGSPIAEIDTPSDTIDDRHAVPGTDLNAPP